MNCMVYISVDCTYLVLLSLSIYSVRSIGRHVLNKAKASINNQPLVWVFATRDPWGGFVFPMTEHFKHVIERML